MPFYSVVNEPLSVSAARSIHCSLVTEALREK